MLKKVMWIFTILLSFLFSITVYAEQSATVNLNFEHIVKPTPENPVTYRQRYILRKADGRNLAVRSNDGYSFFAGNADEEGYKDGSFVVMMIYLREGYPCRGDVFFEYNKETNETKLVECCVVHGAQELDLDKHLEYAKQTMGWAFQLSDRVPIDVLGGAVIKRG